MASLMIILPFGTGCIGGSIFGIATSIMYYSTKSSFFSLWTFILITGCVTLSSIIPLFFSKKNRQNDMSEFRNMMIAAFIFGFGISMPIGRIFGVVGVSSLEIIYNSGFFGKIIKNI